MSQTVGQIREKALKELDTLARKFRLQINPGDYKNSKIKLPFRCLVCGYEGTKSLELLKQCEHGCKVCARRSTSAKQKLSSKDITSTASKLGIEVKLDDYSNTSQKIPCRCLKCGHTWATTVGCIRSGRSCPKCGRRRANKKTSLTEDDIKQRLKKIGIKLISNYINNHEKIQVRFEKCGHLKCVTWNDLQRGRRCADCAPNKRLTLDDYKAVAMRFGGKLISSPTTADAKLLWECIEGHRFRRSIRPMLRFNTFCTKCNDGWGESLCRAVLEKSFGKSFDRVRPTDLRSPKGIPLELDCFNKELGIALEHQGLHHIKRQPNWQTEEQFKLCQQHDQLKRAYCNKNGILLIEIPEVGSLTPPQRVPHLIAMVIKSSGKKVPRGIEDIDVSALKIKTSRCQYTDSVLVAAKKLGLKILDDLGRADSNVRVRCKYGHETQKTLRSILQGRSCNSCKLHKSVQLSDGRVFKSCTDAANALGVSKERVNLAIRRGSTIDGISIVRL